MFVAFERSSCHFCHNLYVDYRSGISEFRILKVMDFNEKLKNVLKRYFERVLKRYFEHLKKYQRFACYHYITIEIKITSVIPGKKWSMLYVFI